MNNAERNRLKEAYFEDKTSSEEEKLLKNDTSDTYFAVLKEEKTQKMDWSFEDFLAVAEPKTTPKIVSLPFKRTLYWAVASVALIICGTLVFKPTSTVKPTQYADKKTQHKTNGTDTLIPTEIIKVEQPILAEKIVEKSHLKPTKKTPIPDEQPTYNPEYVVINGKPIYDLEEAKEVTINSLNLFANNVEKSVSEMDNIKHLSVKF